MTSLFGAAAAAEAYEENLVQRVFLPFARRLVSDAGVGPGDRVADLACGTGAVTRLCAAVGARAVGVDLTPAMLAVARRTVPAAAFVVGDAARVPLATGRADLVLCQQGLQFVPDRPAAVREMRRVVRPGGAVVVSCWAAPELNPVFAGFRAALRAVGWSDLELMFRVPFSLPADELADLHRAAGFEHVETREVALSLPVDDPRGIAQRYVSSPPFAASWEAATDVERERYLDVATEGLAPGGDAPFVTAVCTAR